MRARSSHPDRRSARSVTACLLAMGGLFAAWMSGMHIPIASGATYMRIAKVNPIESADRVSGAPNGVFFVLLVGNDSRPGVGGARGDALHVLGVNPAQKKATLLDIPRDTCWNGDKINVGNTIGPRRRRTTSAACSVFRSRTSSMSTSPPLLQWSTASVAST